MDDKRGLGQQIMGYQSILAGMGNQKSIGQQVFDTALQYMIKDVFDDSIDPQITLNMQRNINRTNAQRSSVNDVLGTLKLIEGNMDTNITNYFEQLDTRKFIDMKEKDDETRFMFREGGAKDGKVDYSAITDYGVNQVKNNPFLLSQQAQLKKYKDEGITYIDPNDGREKRYDNTQLQTMIDVMAGQMNQFYKAKENDYRLYMETTEQAAEIKDLFADSKDDDPKLMKYQSSSTGMIDLLDTFSERLAEMQERNMTNRLTTDFSDILAKAKKAAGTLNVLASLEQDPKDLAGLQISDAIKGKDSNFGMIFEPTGYAKKDGTEDDDLTKPIYSEDDALAMSLLERYARTDQIENHQGQKNIPFSVAEEAIDRYIAAGEFDEAMAIAKKILPGGTDAAKMQSLINYRKKQEIENRLIEINPVVDELNTAHDNVTAIFMPAIGQGTAPIQFGDGEWYQFGYNPGAQTDDEFKQYPFNTDFRNRAIAIANNLGSITKLTKTNYSRDAFIRAGNTKDNLARELLATISYGEGGAESGNMQYIEVMMDGKPAYFSVGGTTRKKGDDNIETRDLMDESDVSAAELDMIIAKIFPKGSNRMDILKGKYFGLREGTKQLSSFDKSSGMEFKEAQMMDEAFQYYDKLSEVLNVYKKGEVRAEDIDNQQAKLDNTRKDKDGNFDYAWDKNLVSINQTTQKETVAQKNKNSFLISFGGVQSAARNSWNKNADGSTYPITAGSDSLNVTTGNTNTMVSFADHKQGAIFGYNSIYNHSESGKTVKQFANVYSPGKGNENWLGNFMAELGIKNANMKLSDIPLHDIASGVLVAEGSIKSGTKAPTLDQVGINKEFLANNRKEYLALQKNPLKPKPKQKITLVKQPGETKVDLSKVDLKNLVLPTDLGTSEEIFEQASEILNIEEAIKALGADTQADEIMATIERLKSENTLQRSGISGDYTSINNPQYTVPWKSSKVQTATLDYFKSEQQFLNDIHNKASDLGKLSWIDSFTGNFDNAKKIIKDINTNGRNSKYYNPHLDSQIQKYNAHRESFKDIKSLWATDDYFAPDRKELTHEELMDMGPAGIRAYQREFRGATAKLPGHPVDKDYYSGQELYRNDLNTFLTALEEEDPKGKMVSDALPGGGRGDAYWKEDKFGEGKYRKELNRLNDKIREEQSEMDLMSGTKSAALKILDDLRLLRSEKGKSSILVQAD